MLPALTKLKVHIYSLRKSPQPPFEKGGQEGI